ncbi:hypothetical protein CCAN2_1780007 [Capnocytophaga canimorsus]|nr:hypothetical protein CCAN2_1780007 [Capnocytophaga canimorsus]
MTILANELRFEEAQQIKEKIDILENYQAKSTIVSSKINNVDVFSIVSDEEFGYVKLFASSLRGNCSGSYHRNQKKIGRNRPRTSRISHCGHSGTIFF